MDSTLPAALSWASPVRSVGIVFTGLVGAGHRGHRQLLTSPDQAAFGQSLDRGGVQVIYTYFTYLHRFIWWPTAPLG